MIETRLQNSPNEYETTKDSIIATIKNSDNHIDSSAVDYLVETASVIESLSEEFCYKHGQILPSRFTFTNHLKTCKRHCPFPCNPKMKSSGCTESSASSFQKNIFCQHCALICNSEYGLNMHIQICCEKL